MSRRRRKANPFSLFSFQDIVTSVTAVLILVALFLALELIHRELNASPAVADTAINTLRNAIRDAEARIAERRRAFEQSHNELQTMASKSPEDLRVELSSLIEQTGLLEREKVALEKKLQSLRRTLEAQAARDAERRDVRRRLAAITTAARDADCDFERKKNDTKVVYNPTSDSGKRVWLVVVNRTAISACAIDMPDAPMEFASRVWPTASEAFNRWLSTRNSSNDCFFVLARPEGIKAAEDVIGALRTHGFDTGFDLVGQQERVTVPKQKGMGS